MVKESSSGLADILYSDHDNSKKQVEKIRYEMDKLDEPKHKITNPMLFAKGREVLGNIISKRMKTSGGTDIDWLIEHNGGFMIFELKTFHDDRIVISKAQMSAYERLYDTLPNCHVLFIGHDDINFKDLNDPVWFFEMKDWKSGMIPRVEDNLSDPTYGDGQISGYKVERDFMKAIDVKILRDKIDSIWEKFEKKQ